MTLKLEDAKELFRKATINQFYRHDCPKCGETIIVDFNDVEHVLFEPYEKEEDVLAYDLETLGVGCKVFKTKKKFTYSSDPSKDTYKFVCPVCGEVIELTRDEFFAPGTCALDGEKHRMFILSASETKRAEEFIEKHKHTKEFLVEKGSPFFSTLGMQFTYSIVPGGFGNDVSIKCNHCKEIKNITDDSEW